MLINQPGHLVFLIVISLVTGSLANDVLTTATKDKGSKCWNGLGKCDDMCTGNTSRKVDYSCKDLNTCCVPYKITIAVNSIDGNTDQFGGKQSCALNNGKCHVKCLSPLTVYRGSYNECPLRYFCCIQNPKASQNALKEKIITTTETDDSSGHTSGSASKGSKGKKSKDSEDSGGGDDEGSTEASQESTDGSEGSDKEDKADKADKEDKTDDKTEDPDVAGI